MLENTKTMRPIKADQIKTGFFRAFCRIHEPTTQVLDIGFVQSARLNRIISECADRLGGDGQWNFFRIQIRTVYTRIRQLNSSQGTMFLHFVGHLVQHRNIFVLPQPQLNERRNFRCMVHLTLLRENNTPTTFGLWPAHGGGGRWIAVTAPIAMRDLIEPIFGRHWTDLHRLEKDVIPRIAHRVTPERMGLLDSGDRKLT